MELARLEESATRQKYHSTHIIMHIRLPPTNHPLLPNPPTARTVLTNQNGESMYTIATATAATGIVVQCV